ncbi:MAG: alkaline phosphatase family protein [Acidimicrobiales bacterium]
MKSAIRARWRTLARATLALGVAGLVLTACGGSTAAPPSTSTSLPQASVPQTPHIMVLMMENQSYSDIVGNPAAPYETTLSKEYETATDYYGIGHYSLDNYLALLTGRFYPWSTGDCTPGSGCQSSNSTLVNQLNGAHIPWSAYMGSMPSDCDTNNYQSGHKSYAVRHDPFVYFPHLVRADCGRIRPASEMVSALNRSSPPDFVWLSPGVCQDGGGDEACATIANGDSYLSKEIPAIQATRWYAGGGIIVLSYDEGNGQGAGEYLHGAGNHVFTIIISAATKGMADDNTYVNHFGLLAGIEKAYGLSCLQEACSPSNGLLTLTRG